MDMNLLTRPIPRYRLPSFLSEGLAERYKGMTRAEVTDNVIERHRAYFDAISDLTGVSAETLKDIYRGGSEATGYDNRLYDLLSNTSHEAIIVASAPEKIREQSLAFSITEHPWHFGFFTGQTDISDYESPYVESNILILDEIISGRAREIHAGVFEKLSAGFEKAFPGILHDILHGIMPIGNSPDSYPEYMKALHIGESFAAEGQTSFVQYEAMVQGFHALLINEAPSLREHKLEMIKGLIQIHEAAHDLGLIARTQLGYSDEHVKPMLDYFNGMIGWMAWHAYRPDDPDYEPLKNVLAQRDKDTGHLLPRRAKSEQRLNLDQLIADGGQAAFNTSEATPVVKGPDGVVRHHSLAMQHMRESPKATQKALTDTIHALGQDVAAIKQRRQDPKYTIDF